MNPTERVRAALTATPSEYLDQTIAARSGFLPKHAANYYPNLTPIQIFDLLWQGPWSAFSHPAIKEPNAAFSAPIPGVSGVVRLKDLKPDAKVTLAPTKDPNALQAYVVSPHEGVKTNQTIVVLGPTHGVETVWSIDPGEPASASTFLTIQGLAGAQMTVAEALALKLVWAQLTV